MTSGKKKPSKPSHAKPGPRPHSGSSSHSSSSHSSSSHSSSSSNWYDLPNISSSEIGTIVDIDGNSRTISNISKPKLHYGERHNYYDPSEYNYGILSDQLYAKLLEDYDKLAKDFDDKMTVGGFFTFGITWFFREQFFNPTATLFNGDDISLIKKLDFKNNIGFTDHSTIIVLPLYSDDPVSVEYY